VTFIRLVDKQVFNKVTLSSVIKQELNFWKVQVKQQVQLSSRNFNQQDRKKRDKGVVVSLHELQDWRKYYFLKKGIENKQKQCGIGKLTGAVFWSRLREAKKYTPRPSQ
jgi:hypothetical protein